ncbi:probable inactive DNA (cytosine-5)-methyltransferase DRM3 isoform X2 [Gastrolobium bilobum]|uniref:probable inactive DNA (cytosine-5)-methyltransferase DRM3 isoform X2 n=1 Tax=Gastrolobium bilobum TaxID=150636 RepID=UPI002AB1D934|nr:probable inactive DNA (cytosine-5)-methyltransferase DRM3 isoform X2 [Gastrolobium bilobum]
MCEENSETLLEVLLRYSAHKSNCNSSDSLEGSPNTSRGRRSAPNFCSDGHSKQALQISNSESSDSLDSLFDDKDPPEISMVNQPKEEPDELDEVIEDRRGSLLMMNFSAEEVEFAMHRLGDEASVPELVDFIFAAQIAKKFKKETDDITCDDRGNETNNEKLYEIMAKTLQLLQMGFSEDEVSSAFDKLGPEVPISEFTNFIFAEQNGIEYVMEYKYPVAPTYSMEIKDELQGELYGTAEVKVENFSHEPSQSRQVNLEETYGGQRVKEEEYIDEFPNAVSDMRYSDFVENDRGKRPKYEYNDDSNFCLDSYWVEEKVDTSKLYKSNPSRCLSRMAAKPPFFLYGNVSNISDDSWAKMSQFLYGIEPEFVSTQVFSALNRIEGYVHNLPVENRFHILPKPPMTIEDAIPQTKKWWPPWDSRKQLSSISCETNGIAQLCDRLGSILADSGGVVTSQQKNDILRYCRGLNLLWIGKYKLGPMEPEHLELILGYPLNHTRASENNLTERLKSLKCCFQTDTLGYHLSVLKPIFPSGLTLLSLFSGIGGAEIALHRLDIKIKAVVSVETCETKRKILERWWRNSGQNGTLVQIEDIQRLTSKKLGNLISKFGGFDLVIYQNPNTQSSSSAFDFTSFCESVRVLQRVRGLGEKK